MNGITINKTTDIKILNEVYKLRIEAWQTNGYLNPNSYPNGWRDELDNSATIWVATFNKEVVASCRVNVFENFDFACYSRINQLCQIITKQGIKLKLPIAYNSRMVVKQKYRNKGVSKMLDEVRLRFIKNYGAKAIISTTDLKWRKESLVKQGWNYVSKVNPEFDINSEKGQSYIVCRFL